MKGKWVIEGYFGSDSSGLQRIPLTNLPLTIGRDPALALSIEKPEVSRNHAELIEVHGKLVVRDLNSTNGTFLNHKKIGDTAFVNHGDVIHVASYEVRLILQGGDSVENRGDKTILNFQPLSSRLPIGLSGLARLLEEREIVAQFQPIVRVNGELYGFEVLGRGSRNGLPATPYQLFTIAESMAGQAAKLSEVMRDCGVEQGHSLSGSNHRLFVNTHPEELINPGYLLSTVKSLRSAFPSLPLVLEIHEDAITDVGKMVDFARELKEIDVELAFDDFGAGQSRLAELIDVPVNYVKFDISLISGLPSAPESKRKMVSALVEMTRAMGISALAEGVESRDELDLCSSMAFDFIQGFYFGKPDDGMNYLNPLL